MSLSSAAIAHANRLPDVFGPNATSNNDCKYNTPMVIYAMPQGPVRGAASCSAKQA